MVKLAKIFSWQKFLHIRYYNNYIVLSLHNNFFLSHGLLILRQRHSKLSKFGHHFLWIFSNVFLDEGIHLLVKAVIQCSIETNYVLKYYTELEDIFWRD